MFHATARDIAQAIARGEVTALQVTERLLARIEAVNPRLNAFTHVTRDRALRKAASVDRARSGGEDLGPLAGVPYAVKNLFDIDGLVTLAGAKINRGHAPASADARLGWDLLSLRRPGWKLIHARGLHRHDAVDR